MKITKGYVAVAPDGSFYQKTSHHTHVGMRHGVKPVIDIEDATVFNAPAFDEFQLRHLHPVPKVSGWAEVEVRRTVALKGYGVKEGGA